jgi:hypothetical protein
MKQTAHIEASEQHVDAERTTGEAASTLAEDLERLRQKYAKPLDVRQTY